MGGWRIGGRRWAAVALVALGVGLVLVAIQWPGPTYYGSQGFGVDPIPAAIGAAVLALAWFMGRKPAGG